MAEHDVDILQLDPEDQLSLFSKSSLLKTVIISVLIHLAIIGASWGAKFLAPPKEAVKDAAATPEDQPEETEAAAETEKKPDEKKPDEKKPDEKKPDEKKPDGKEKPWEGKQEELKDPTNPFKLD